MFFILSDFFQVASGRGIIAHFFNLNVLVPQAFILGAKEYHVQQGTVISLVCIIENVSKLELFPHCIFKTKLNILSIYYLNYISTFYAFPRRDFKKP